nr:chemotaxis protein CheB [Rugamonas sp. CCM 8940]
MTVPAVPNAASEWSADGAPAPAPALTVAAAEAPVPVIGIGASAGGLEAIVELLASVPVDSGLAFVVVQHLDPTHKGMLPELLQRVTMMPVREAGAQTPIEANCVYVIPPNKDLGFAHGALTTLEPREQRGHRLPIDSFLHALARERQALAAGIVLSGMGADGTLGLQAIKENGGLTLAQLPASAKFDPMPQHAINAGAVDIVAEPRDMVARLLAWWGHPDGGPLPDPQSAAGRRASLQQLFQLLLQQTGANFSDYKLNTLLRRIERRMKLCQVGALGGYVDYLRENPAEVELLFKELLIGGTSFFRDPKVWDYLKHSGLPQMLAAHPEGAALKAWVPACSTGEEAYTLAIVFNEVVEQLKPEGRFSLQIFATDLDPDAIDRARTGVFGSAIEAAVTPERLRRYFVPVDGGGYRIRKDLRSTIIFAPQNIISDPPFTKLDVLCCRNLLIYFNVKLQDQLIPLFHYALKPDGLLVFGSADTPGRFTELFTALPGAGRIYQRQDASRHRVAHYFPTRVANIPVPPLNEPRAVSMNGNIQTQVEQQLLKKHTPAAVLLNGQGDILYIHGRTGAYLEPAVGKANWNIHAMAREGIGYVPAIWFIPTCRATPSRCCARRCSANGRSPPAARAGARCASCLTGRRAT